MMGTAPELTVLENFRLAALRTATKGFVIGTGGSSNPQSRKKISRLHLGLENKIKQPVGTLSGGQRQALTLLMAVMDETKILLMDEPTAALDPRTSALLLELADKMISEFRLTVFLWNAPVEKKPFRSGNRILLA
jgi:putative ABC transport system ATP-binding protein